MNLEEQCDQQEVQQQEPGEKSNDVCCQEMKSEWLKGSTDVCCMVTMKSEWWFFCVYVFLLLPAALSVVIRWKQKVLI